MKFDKISELLAGMKIGNRIFKVGDKIEVFNDVGIVTKLELKEELVYIKWKGVNISLSYTKNSLKRNMII